MRDFYFKWGLHDLKGGLPELAVRPAPGWLRQFPDRNRFFL